VFYFYIKFTIQQESILLFVDCYGFVVVIVIAVVIVVIVVIVDIVVVVPFC